MTIASKALLRSAIVASLVAAAMTPIGLSAQTLSDLPLYSASSVPANLMLALSVEFPTGTVAAYKDANGFSPSNTYLGYFDPLKCYSYNGTYFSPAEKIATTSTSCTSGNWSGNLLNWATMTALDEFRKTLTGGTRDSGETAALTVLVRSNLNDQSNATNFPNKTVNFSTAFPASSVVGITAFASASALYFRSSGLNYTFQVSNKSDYSANVMTFNAKVQACAAGLLEDNCTAYGSNFKPEGLIQQNYKRIRVGAVAYGAKQGDANPNGAVRALLRDNGPTTYNGNAARQANPYAEWSATDGTLFANPAANDAGAYGAVAPDGTAFTKSGVINYLNSFGQNGYEKYDTISELYWSALAYLMRQPLNASYTSSYTASNTLDTSFPVFKGLKNDKSDSNDPMQYKCAANAIVVIGDAHTHCDQRLPSAVGPGNPGGNTYCQNQSPGAIQGGVDASTWTTKLGALPMVEADGNGGTASATFSATKFSGKTLGSQVQNPSNRATWFIAGLAYYAHVNDIRGDLDGKQTVDTYVVDVMEPGDYDGTSSHPTYSTKSDLDKGPNQYWLAAKYGGFTDAKGDGVPSSFLSWHTNTSTAAGGDLRPDNYFVGNRPDLIASGLASIFANVATTASLSASGPSVSATRVLTEVAASAAPYKSPVAGFPIYTTSYFPGGWSGEVNGFVAKAALGADVTAATGANTWSAQLKLDTLGAYVSTVPAVVGWRDLRRILTYKAGTGGVPFEWASLSSGQQSALGSESLLNWVRGDRSKEGASFRIRNHLLGDIVNSQASLVQNALSPNYNDAYNPGYSAFATTVANRVPVVYVGANDGMLHAFKADFSASTNTLNGGGAELFAYVPSFVFNGPNNTPLVDGLAANANLKGATTNAFIHHFYVDQTPQVADVDFNRAGTSSQPGTYDWRTLLVGGMGKGGKGIYALDVSSVPADLGTAASATFESDLQNKVLWEFTDSHMGYSFSRPLIAKTRQYGWVVLLTSGYNNDDGKGYLYVINAKTGALLTTIKTTIGSTSKPIGLSRPSGYVQNTSDNTVDQVYAGDLQGNVWRFDLTATTGGYPSPVIIATLKDPAGVPQPITTAPRIELDFDTAGLSTRRWVFVGTGKFLDTSDLTDTQQQTMYALRDGTGTTPAVVSTPITRTDLKKNNLIDDLGIQDTDAGWYYDLTGVAPNTGGATERIVVDPDAVAGIFSINWGTLIPTADPCSLSGAVYSAAYGSGKSNLLTADGKATPYLTTNSAITNLQMVQLPGTGKFVLLYGQTGQAPQVANMLQPGNSGRLLRTNWREILN
jgi:type IV pilus assembly protein PilY1